MTKLKAFSYKFLLALFTLTLATSVAKAQTYTDLHDFNETEGCCALAPSMLAQGQDGNIYGATTSGGVHFYGNIFKMTTSGTVTDIHDFDLTHGGYPQGGISMGTDGNFYGTTYQGGNGYGTVFKITPSGTFTELYDFNNTNDGAYPKTPPVQAQDGNLYGTTYGTTPVLYKITTAGAFTVMANLASQTYSPLLLASDGNLYGTTLSGGTFNGGTVFQFSPTTKVLKTIFNFHTEYSPWGPLMQGVDGALYGTTSAGGTGSGGVVYKVTTAGTYTVLTNFSTSNSANGATPYSGVVQGSDKFIYGVTSSGGANKLGVLFKISTTGTGYTVLHNFDTTTGDSPLSTPLLHTNGTIYGLTSHGGSHVPYGVAYSMNVSLKAFVAPVVLQLGQIERDCRTAGTGLQYLDRRALWNGVWNSHHRQRHLRNRKNKVRGDHGRDYGEGTWWQLDHPADVQNHAGNQDLHPDERSSWHLRRDHRHEPATGICGEVRRQSRHNFHRKFRYAGHRNRSYRSRNRQDHHHYTRRHGVQQHQLHRELKRSRGQPLGCPCTTAIF